MNYNIIGDIHGRACWQQLVREDSVNIFVGDYFDPYEEMSHAELLYNFNELIRFKTQHPETVLLYGNHDLHYLIDTDRSTRYDARHAMEYRQLFAGTQHLFAGAAFAVRDEYLVTHAGVTKDWYEKEFGGYNGEPIKEVAETINDLWRHNKNEFTFRANAMSPYDIYGESPTHSPLWIRPWVLAEHNLFAGTPFKQVFGHTQTDGISTIDDNLIGVDCLGTTPQSYRIIPAYGHYDDK